MPNVPTRTDTAKRHPLERRVSAIEDQLEAMRQEVRTERLVVVDEHGRERVVTQVRDGYTELRVSNAEKGRREVSTFMAVEGTVDDGSATGDMVISGGGCIRAHLPSLVVPGGWSSSMDLEDLHDHTTLSSGEIQHTVFE